MIKKPGWLLVPHQKNANAEQVEHLLNTLGLNTVCSAALCPNRMECYGNKTATFMILGTNCTRNCLFCNVNHALPFPIDPEEPDKIAQAVKSLGLAHVVITSVTRDDLSDGGAFLFYETIIAIKKYCENTAVEVLIPDFKGSIEALKVVSAGRPDVIAHNVETVPSLYEKVRKDAIYNRSLEMIERVKQLDSSIYSKSGLMVGLGETKAQVLRVMDDLRKANCDFLTIGQYLSPDKRHFPVAEYIHPEVFDMYKEIALEKGFSHVASGPFVRSSYHANEALSHRDRGLPL